MFSTINAQEVPEGWALCEIGMDWSKNCDTRGAAWIAKNNRGEVMEHSRRAFAEVKYLGEAKLQVILWAVESMKSLKKKKVRFVSTFGDLVEAVEKPARWPALQFEISEIQRELQAFEAWELRLEKLESIRCVSLIAQNVRSLGLYQSYVPADHPHWLDCYYGDERGTSNA